MSSGEHSGPQSSPSFATTRWSLVLRAGDRKDESARRSLEALCRQYWLPLYAFVRRRIANAADAQDLTQAFFVHLIEKEVLARASPERGRFRSFLLAAVKNFLANELDRARAQKRGGGAALLSLDFAAGEARIGLDPAHHLTAERLFERHWALALLETVTQRLQAEYAATGRSRLFERLKAALTGERPHDYYRDAAAELGLSADAGRQAARRMRKRYRELLRDEVSQTVESPAEVDDEIRRLFAVLGESTR